MLAILEVLRMFFRSFQGSLIVASDSFNAVSWVNNNGSKPRNLQFSFNEMKALVSSLSVEFRHVLRLANGFADGLAKQGVSLT